MKQKVFLYTERGANDPNIELFKRDFYYRDFEVIVTVSMFGGGGQLGIDSIPREILIQFPIILLEPKDLQSTVDLLVARGIPPKNLIIWNSIGKNQPIIARESDSTVIRIDGLELHCKTDSDLKDANEILNYLQMMKIQYKIPPAEYENVIGQFLKNCTGLEMNWKDPRTIQEKIQWLKLYDSTPLKTLCADKFRVREYVARKIGAEYLIPLIGVWEDPDEIDLNSLPNRFVLKANHGSGMNIIVKDKSRFDFEIAKEKLRAWLMVDYGILYFEFHYCRMNRKIIAEEFIQSLDSDDVPDYKFYCFHGEPRFIQLESDRGIDLRFTLFDLNWEFMPFQRIEHKHLEKIPPRPKNLEKMIEFAKKLSADFSFVRVDFYEIGDQIFVGELTFLPMGGIFMYSPSEWNFKIGEYLKLPPKSKPFNRFET